MLAAIQRLLGRAAERAISLRLRLFTYLIVVTAVMGAACAAALLAREVVMLAVMVPVVLYGARNYPSRRIYLAVVAANMLAGGLLLRALDQWEVLGFAVAWIALVTTCEVVWLAARARERLEAERGRQSRDLGLINQVSAALASQLDLDALLRETVEQIHRAIGFRRVTIYSVDGAVLRMRHQIGWANTLNQLSVERGVMGRCIRTGQSQYVPDVALDADYVNPLPEARSEAALPIRDRGELFGVLNVETTASDPRPVLAPSDVDMLEAIAEQVGLAVGRARLLGEILLSRDAALEASRAKSAFLATMSHELRTPLNVILGSSELLADDLPEGEPRDLARMIGEAGQTLLDVINDVLDLSRIEAGKLDMQPDCQNVDEMLASAVRLLSARARAKGLALEIVPPSDGARAWCDVRRVRQVLFNLLGNAIKFTDQGGVRAGATVLSADGPVRLWVRDSGPGIPDDARDRLFKPFSQVDGTIARRFGGTGMGLSICKQLVELMGGEIGVDSVPGAGSEFWFTLPLADAAACATAVTRG